MSYDVPDLHPSSGQKDNAVESDMEHFNKKGKS